MADHDGRRDPLDPFDPQNDPDRWLRAGSEGEEEVEVSADFVERTLRAVLEDRRRLAAGATADDSVEIPHELLATWRTPAPSPGFVERSLEFVLDELRHPGLRGLLQAYHPFEPSATFVDRTAKLASEVVRRRLDAALEAHTTPEPSRDFVARTVERVRAAAPRVPAWRRRLVRAGTAAAALAALVTLAFLLHLLPSRTRPVQEVPAAFELGPAPVSAALFAAAVEDSPTFTVGDGLVLLAYGSREGE